MPSKNDGTPGAAAVPRAIRQPAGAQSAGRGLDWLNLFVANIQTGFGPFIAVYLTTQGWTQGAIGFALSIGTITAMASQVPAGALVDTARSKSFVALVSILAFSASALCFAVNPLPLFVYLAEVLHGFSSCTLGPAIAAMSLAIAGRTALGIRFGRNARFGSVGNAAGAALMGAVGFYVSERSVFFLTALLTIPALIALLPLRRIGDAPHPSPPRKLAHRAKVLADRRLLIFAACAMLFNLANAAMLPLAGGALTKRASGEASLLIAACIVLPQLVVALVSPSVGRLAQSWGRRPVLLAGFAMLPLRGLLFALVSDPTLVVAVQIFDGVAAASFGVLMPLIVSDITGHTRHFNFSLGFVGFAIGIGATFSTGVAGWIADRLGDPAAFGALAAVGLVATLLVWVAMPETRPQSD
jgi:MFS family permease